ncbi:UDP-N-acetylglucosamine 1-carboxyvinyltransferase [Pseudobacteroides cellulosolvens]|uniref:UDP-N-acetylglucosamine 1-carboxyvinyltransferase n=1 Tax=Pseudobacteroides cellulosolvens ATCC 35603 = DSM 2933 TaxID=398512 RepID=A0A0L6JW23_9FIRM|nr:UDP-N-acetylglucosamine 1-carboxyvinyltransferase [Pseudobacteroides cellulosolvens]KNY29632.1 UDP-N-acetylglucosamine 1-carboxyvinyltransferase [Pseudobacteroides cellulosolvens ATCC 35603 = DSM 2933]
MDKFVIRSQRALNGEVNISGAKNAAVAIIPAALLVDGPCKIENIPDISDVRVLIDIISKLGAEVKFDDENSISVNTQYLSCYSAPYEMVKSIRASYYLIGALLGRFKKAEVALPGGCDFGFRPIDQHIKGFEALGANVVIEHGIVKVYADKLVGAQIYLDVVSLGATINLMLAAVKAEGTTIIENAAKEPYVVDVANFLNAMGANVKGAGTDVIKIKGVEVLSGGLTHSIIPDMIEAGTFMVAGAATKGDVVVKNIIPKHVESLTAKLIEMNVKVIEGEDWIRVQGTDHITKANIKTLPYPGFPTDLHPLATILLCLADGTSTVTEGVWDSRFQYVDELKRMGAKIKVEGRMALVEGPESLTGAPVKATDLRGGAAMVIAALTAQGVTEVHNIRLIDRGYEKFDIKLRSLGADIIRVSEPE